MIKVYLIGLSTKDTRGNGQWDGIVEEIKNINPDKIYTINFKQISLNSNMECKSIIAQHQLL
jgi:hypothetical protein